MIATRKANDRRRLRERPGSAARRDWQGTLAAAAGSVVGGAVFDSTSIYRYRLWRQWNPTRPRLAMLMLNPSTADAIVNDATISSCMRIADNAGYGSICVVNLFAFRATQPSKLKCANDPVGKDNDSHIVQAAQEADALLVAWGNHGRFRQRSDEVKRLLSRFATKTLCLGVTRLGEPRHPLYLKSSTRLIAWRPSGFLLTTALISN